MQETVLLVHGVLMTARVMAVLARRLRGCGYRTVLFDYPTRGRCLRDNAHSLARFVGGLGSPTVHLVGHSMGGMLILRTLQETGGLPPGRVVLMGSPVRSSAVARRLCGSAPGRWLLGESAEGGLLEALPDWSYGREIGVIAGELPVGFGVLLGGLQGRHDGTVGVDETRIEGATDTLVVRASHTSLVLSRQVAGQVCHFLQHGRFSFPSAAS
jgi:pimeloyl-ACP methyl ester carboxylesterase